MSSVVGLLGSTALESLFSRGAQNSANNFKQAFQQLGQDLQSGNIVQAETDLAALQPPAAPGAPSASSTGLVSRALSQVAQDLQSGNLAAAQSDFAGLEQNLQQRTAVYRHHSHSAGSHAGISQMRQLFSQLGQALQSGNLSAAQQAYATLQTDLPGAMFADAPASLATPSPGAGLSLSA